MFYYYCRSDSYVCYFLYCDYRKIFLLFYHKRFIVFDYYFVFVFVFEQVTYVSYRIVSYCIVSYLTYNEKSFPRRHGMSFHGHGGVVAVPVAVAVVAGVGGDDTEFDKIAPVVAVSGAVVVVSAAVAVAAVFGIVLDAVAVGAVDAAAVAMAVPVPVADLVEYIQ